MPNTLRGRHAATDATRHGRRADLVAIGVALVLVAVSTAVGFGLLATGWRIQVSFPPIVATFGPHLGWGTPLALATLAATVLLTRRAATLAWGRLVTIGWLLGLCWIVSLALIDGDWTAIMTSPHEYLSDLDRITDPAQFVATFTDHIVRGPGSWTTHVSAHPPLATLVFWALSQIGLGGGWWAGLACMVVGSIAGPGLAITLAELGAGTLARRLVPLLAIFPGAVWIGVSADGLFAGVALAGLAVLVVGVVRGHVVVALLGGLALGCLLYLSYGHALFGLVVFSVMAVTWRRLARRRWWLGWVAGAVGVSVVVAVFSWYGFWWPDGMAQLRIRYHQGIAADRPYWYFLFANLGALVVASSPLIAVSIRRAVVELAVQRPWTRLAQDSGDRYGPTTVIALVTLSGVAMVVAADISGMSKAETERIWLTFGMLIWSGMALLDTKRPGLLVAGAAGWALAVNHLLVTNW